MLKHILHKDNHVLLENQHVLISRKEANRKRSHINRMRNTSRGLIIVTLTLHYLNPSHRTVKQVEHRIRWAYYQHKNINLTLNEQFESSCLYRASTWSVTTLTNSRTHYTKFMDAKITLKIHIKSHTYLLHGAESFLRS